MCCNLTTLGAAIVYATRICTTMLYGTILLPHGSTAWCIREARDSAFNNALRNLDMHDRYLHDDIMCNYEIRDDSSSVHTATLYRFIIMARPCRSSLCSLHTESVACSTWGRETPSCRARNSDKKVCRMHAVAVECSARGRETLACRAGNCHHSLYRMHAEAVVCSAGWRKKLKCIARQFQFLRSCLARWSCKRTFYTHAGHVCFFAK